MGRKTASPWVAMDLLAQMATFVSVVDGKSLSAAARSQRLSLPAVSRQLRALEQELGATLVARSTRRLHVTDAGLRWYAHCTRLLRDVEDAKASVRPARIARGTLVVSASLAFGTVVVVPRLPQLVLDHPKLVVDLRLEDRMADLVGEGVDLALRAGSPPPDSTQLVAHPLTSLDRVVVASPRWLRKHGTPRDPLSLTRFPCLVQVTSEGATVRWRLRRGEEDVTVDVRGSLRASTPLALRDLAVDGAGLAYIPDLLIQEELAKGRLRRVLPGWSSPPILAWALHRSELRGDPRIAAFLGAMPKLAATPRAS